MKVKASITRLKWGGIFFAVIILCTMLSTCEKNGIAPKPELLPVTASFKVDIEPMLTTYCALNGCHSGTQPPARLDLSMPGAYSNLVAQNMINTSNPTDSRLYTCLYTPMPPWGELINYDKEIILKWIQQGAKNN